MSHFLHHSDIDASRLPASGDSSEAKPSDNCMDPVAAKNINLLLNMQSVEQELLQDVDPVARLLFQAALPVNACQPTNDRPDEQRAQIRVEPHRVAPAVVHRSSRSSRALLGGYLSVLEVRNRDELRDEVVRFGHNLGFRTASAIAVVDRDLGSSDFFCVDNAPKGLAHSFHDPDWGRRDPVLQYCKRHSVPIAWDRSTYVNNGFGNLWEEQARFGYRTGIAIALHMPEGRHFVVGVDRDEDLSEDLSEVTRMVASLQLFAVHAQEAAFRVLMPPEQRLERPGLTPLELNVLRWTMDGKTAWEVSNILGISERTTVLHCNNAMHKLGCVNKHQAVLKALRLGLIS